MVIKKIITISIFMTLVFHRVMPDDNIEMLCESNYTENSKANYYLKILLMKWKKHYSI